MQTLRTTLAAKPVLNKTTVGYFHHMAGVKPRSNNGRTILTSSILMR